VSPAGEHIEDPLLQAYLEGEVDDGVRERVDRHLGSCARCASALEGWRVLFEELQALPEVVGPSPTFRSEVLERLRASPSPVDASFLSRLRTALGRKGRPVAGHLDSTRIQELLEGSLPGRVAEKARAHLEGCAPCREELHAWQGLHQALDALPPISVPEGFAARVMDRLRPLPEHSRVPTAAERFVRWGEALIPSTRRGWTLAACCLGLPALGSLALVTMIVAHPLLDPTDLLAFLGWQAAEFVQVAWGWAIQRAAQPGVLGMVALGIRAASASPGIAIAFLGGAWLSILLSGWVLYRNVIVHPSMANRHAQASS